MVLLKPLFTRRSEELLCSTVALVTGAIIRGRRKYILSNKARSTIRQTFFTKEKEFPDKRGGRGPLGPPLNPPLQTGYF